MAVRSATERLTPALPVTEKKPYLSDQRNKIKRLQILHVSYSINQMYLEARRKRIN
jgi:hypothetical protein